MEYNSKAKLKEKNSSRLTDSKKGQVVTKGEARGKLGGEGGRRELWVIMIGTHGVFGVHREDSVTEKTSSDSGTSYYTDGQ